MAAHDAYALRRQEDISKIRDLQSEFPGVVSVTQTVGNPVTLVELQINLETARNGRFPMEKQVDNIVQFELPTRYPSDPPIVKVITPIWNPNIFPSGLICFGQKWIPTQNLALLVQRVMQILALEPTIINLDSPANKEAKEWYAAAIRRNASLFPTVRLDSLKASAKRKIAWRTIK